MKNFRKFSGKITAESVFFIAFVLYMFSNVFSATQWTYSADDSITTLLWILKAIRYFAYLLFLCKIIIDSFHIKRKNLLCMIEIFLLVFISAIRSSEGEVIFFLLICLAARNIPAKRLVQCTLSIQVTVLFITILCSRTGIVQDYIIQEHFRVRHYLGFRWVTLAPGFFFFILLEYLFLQEKKRSLCQYTFLMIINFWFFKMTGTRLSFAASLFFGAFSLLVLDGVHSIQWRRHGWKIFFLSLPWVCAGLSIWCHVAYDPSKPIWAKINTLLSNRLILGSNAIKQYGFLMWGQKIKWISPSIESISHKIEGYNYVDCSYLQIALQYGIIVLLLLLAGCSCLMARAFREKQYYLCWILTATLIYCMVEPKLLHSCYNPFILLPFSSLSSRRMPSRRFIEDNLFSERNSAGGLTITDAATEHVL